MPLPGLGKPDDAGEERAGRSFKPSDLPANLYVSEAADDEMAALDCYPITDSEFFDGLELDQVAEEREPLSPALTPKIGLKFRTFDARIEAKYGVRNYIREIATFYDEAEESKAALIPNIVSGRRALYSAMALVKRFSEAHVYDLQVRRSGKGAKQRIYLRSLQPRSVSTRVIKLANDKLEDLSGYEDNLVALEQQELLLGNRSNEIMYSLLPLAFTYHAMLRLWERGQGNGRTFHLVMADAGKRLHAVTSLVELSHLSVGCEQLPSQIAVPILDGFLVVSSRSTLCGSDKMRWGFKYKKNWAGYLDSQDQEHFAFENYVSANSRRYTIRESWYAATFMGANDIGAWERCLAARQFDELLSPCSFDEIARLREWVGRSTGKALPEGYEPQIPDPERVIALQSEMLPRADPRDERLHLLEL